MRAWNSKKRIIAIIAGVRSGKSSFLPLWLHREMMACGPGDYLAAAPFFTIIEKALGPEIEAFFGRLMKLGKHSGRHFLISEEGHAKLWPGVPYDRPSRIIFGHGDKPESLAAMNAKAAVLDEAGQKGFRLGSWEEVNRRVAFDQGRILIGTTVYDLGWIKQKLHDEWVNAGMDHPEIDFINFDSTENPAFPKEEYERARRDLPLWKFDMFFRGKFTRPAGLIYDCFDVKNHVRPRRRIPENWPRFVGVDFGAVNTAAVFLAQELHPSSRVPTGKYVVYREYHPGKLPTQTHAVRLLAGDPDRGIPPEPREPTFVGGSRSEDEWRAKFREATIAVMEPPINDVEVQIQAVYEMISAGNLEVMEDVVELLDELASYSRVLDERGEPTEEIDSDNLYHLLGSLRYLVCWLLRGGLGTWHPAIDEHGNYAGTPPPGAFEETKVKDDGEGRRIKGGYYTHEFPDF